MNLLSEWFNDTQKNAQFLLMVHINSIKYGSLFLSLNMK